MPFIENRLQSVDAHSVFVAIYEDLGYLTQFQDICARYGSHIVIPFRDFETAKLHLDTDEVYMHYMSIDSTMAKQDGYNFMKLAEAKFPHLHIFDEIRKMQMEAKKQCGGDHHSFVRWAQVKDYDATQLEALDDVPAGTKIFSGLFKPTRRNRLASFRNDNDTNRILQRLASFRNPALDDSEETGVSTELSL
ncbi:hypothetical protein TSUD_195640 [Trifolium subterraneum]|nr:hypothetical protein TSUD_195640 [Trifolium subterraneum]